MGDYKGALHVSLKVFVGLHESRLGFVTPCDGEISLGPLGNTTSPESCNYMTNEFSHSLTGSFIMERVKRLAGNEIELGMGIPTIESRASNILWDKENCI